MEYVPIINPELIAPQAQPNAKSRGKQDGEQFITHLATAHQKADNKSPDPSELPTEQQIPLHVDEKQSTVKEQSEQNIPISQIQESLQASVINPLSLTKSSSTASQFSNTHFTVAQLFSQENSLTETIHQTDQKTITTSLLDAITQRVNSQLISQNENITLTNQSSKPVQPEIFQLLNQGSINQPIHKNGEAHTQILSLMQGQSPTATQILSLMQGQSPTATQALSLAQTPTQDKTTSVPAGYSATQSNQSISASLTFQSNNTVSFSQDISVEKWSATFSSQDWNGQSITTSAQEIKSTQLPSPLLQAQTTSNNGQFVTVFQAHESAATTANVVTSPLGENKALNGIRQDLNNQYIHTNLPSTIEEETTNLQNNSTGNNEQQQGKEENLFSAQRASQSNKPFEGSNLFSLEPLSGQSATSSSQTLETSGFRYIPGTNIHENHVINQIVERFAFNRRLESGSVTLRLQPEELGNLKMKIQVKQDSIKAHIVAASPQAQEILERNLPKLKEALAQQGLKLDQIEVTVAASDKDNSQPFQDHAQNQHLHQQSSVHNIKPLKPINQTDELDFNQQTDDPQGLSIHA